MNWRATALHVIAYAFHGLNLACAFGAVRPVTGSHPLLSSAIVFLGQCIVHHAGLSGCIPRLSEIGAAIRPFGDGLASGPSQESIQQALESQYELPELGLFQANGERESAAGEKTF